MNDIIFTRAFWMLLRKSFEKQIAAKYNTTFANVVMKSAKINYQNIMSRHLPLIGKRNPKLVDILLSALVAAIYKAGKEKISIKQMDAILVDSLESSFIFRKSIKKSDHFSREWQDKRHSQALLSKQKKNPDDFVCDFTYGKTFDEYGITYYECAIYKLLKIEDCPELTPLFCNFDYIMAKHMNAELRRTRTLVGGSNLCDFWYTKVK